MAHTKSHTYPVLPFGDVFTHSAFVALWAGRILGNVAAFAQSVAVGWLVYTNARQTYNEQESMFLVGMLGLAQFLPMFALALFAGTAADCYDRRKIILSCNVLQLFCAIGLTYLSLQAAPSLIFIFLISGFFGTARTFEMPARMALTPALVPRDVLPKAIAFNTLGVQFGMIVGPWLGGMLCDYAPSLALAATCGLFFMTSMATLWLLRMPVQGKPQHNGAARLTMIREGLAHLWANKIVFGAISLDLFAVLLGGVTALLPAYAKDILNIGPEGFGQLRSMFALGAGGMTLLLAVRPIQNFAGHWMLGSVVLFGLATLVFALSRQTGLSMAALMVAGAADSISVFVRHNLVQILTPDAMRGRVSAVSSLFISASNELGEFESGIAARYFGIVGSAVFGGIGSIVVTGLWAYLFPALRQVDRLDGQHNKGTT
ncbi:MAG: MFS transporter [Magnetococcales bacterium]|nr:MFS transporter [Magnetococcales bacterium]MBF0418880.1 MFS transporter [Magnetococcales bacterium]MBF0433817.1 MFS transporter [Magnetococcales bacterium]